MHPANQSYKQNYTRQHKPENKPIRKQQSPLLTTQKNKTKQINHNQPIKQQTPSKQNQKTKSTNIKATLLTQIK